MLRSIANFASSSSGQAGAGMPGARSIVPYLFPLGLLLVVAVNMVMLWLALDTFPGAVTRNAYEEGRKYNRVLELDAVRDRMGWTVDLSTRSGRPLTIEARYRDREGVAIDGMAPKLQAVRPVGPSHAVDLVMTSVGNGVYRASPRLDQPGQWVITVTAAGTTGVHQVTARITVR